MEMSVDRENRAKIFQEVFVFAGRIEKAQEQIMKKTVAIFFCYFSSGFILLLDNYLRFKRTGEWVKIYFHRLLFKEKMNKIKFEAKKETKYLKQKPIHDITAA